MGKGCLADDTHVLNYDSVQGGGNFVNFVIFCKKKIKIRMFLTEILEHLKLFCKKFNKLRHHCDWSKNVYGMGKICRENYISTHL